MRKLITALGMTAGLLLSGCVVVPPDHRAGYHEGYHENVYVAPAPYYPRDRYDEYHRRY